MKTLHILLFFSWTCCLQAQTGENFDSVTEPTTQEVFSSPDPTLPVEIGAFHGWQIGEKAALRWVTESENNSAYFIIQHSADAENFTNIGSLPTSRESEGELEYVFTHERPILAHNYYRLKHVEQDNTFTYSDIISLRFLPAEAIVLFPNPVREELQFWYDRTMWREDARFEICNTTGQAVHSAEVAKGWGMTLNVENLEQGVYFLRVISGKRKDVARFIKL